MVISKGIVTNVNHQRLFGFIKLDGVENQIFFHFSQHGIAMSLRDEIMLVNSNRLGITYPKKGDTVYFRYSMHFKGPKADVWVYDIEYLFEQTLRLKNKYTDERSKPENGSNGWGYGYNFRGFNANTGQHQEEAKKEEPPKQPPLHLLLKRRRGEKSLGSPCTRRSLWNS